MALQNSGPISLKDIQDEFTGSNPISLGEYYNGKGYVIGGNPTIPSSGAISFSNFYGTQRAQYGATVSVLNTVSTAPVDITSRMGLVDPYTWIVVVKTQFSSKKLPGYLTPQVNGSNMSLIVTQSNGFSNDGHRVGAWYIQAPQSGSITVTPRDGYRMSVYKVTGIKNFATNHTHTFVNPSSSRLAFAASASITGEAGNSSVMGFATSNFSDRGGITSVTNDDENYGIPQHNVTWLDRLMATNTVTYSLSSTRAIVQIGLVRVTYDIPPA